MSKAIENGNKPAMPCEINFPNGDVEGYLGMTKRETMAMHLMAGLVANPKFDDASWEALVGAANKAADALLEAGDE